MTRLFAEAFISQIETLEERRDGLERRVRDVGAMEEKRSGEDRRRNFRAKNKPTYYSKCLNGMFDEFMSDRGYDAPIIITTDGEKTIEAPYDIIYDWLGWDLKLISLNDIYVDPESREKVLSHVKEGEFTRFFPHIKKRDGSTIVLDVLMTYRTTDEGTKQYCCFVGLET